MLICELGSCLHLDVTSEASGIMEADNDCAHLLWDDPEFSVHKPVYNSLVDLLSI